MSETLKSQKKKKKDKLNNKTIELLKPENEAKCIAKYLEKYLEKEDSFVESFYLEHFEYILLTSFLNSYGTCTASV